MNEAGWLASGAISLRLGGHGDGLPGGVMATIHTYAVAESGSRRKLVHSGSESDKVMLHSAAFGHDVR